MPLRIKLIRKGAQAVWRLQRAVTLGAQAMVIEGGARVLLIRHGYQAGWHFPGGGVEKNESAEAAMRRELMEEAGLSIGGRPELFGLYTNFQHFPSDHVALFLVRDFVRSVDPKPCWEVRERAFFELDNLPEGASGGVRRRLAEFTSGGARSAEW